VSPVTRDHAVLHACDLAQAKTPRFNPSLKTLFNEAELVEKNYQNSSSLGPKALTVNGADLVVAVVVNGSYSAAPYSSPDRECITKSQLIKIKHRQST